MVLLSSFLGSTFQGLQGTQGIQGTQGVQGVQGTQGVQGVQGLQGTQGVQGTQGIQGTQGTNGIQGVQGSAGYIGADGSQGTQGIQGMGGVNYNKSIITYSATQGQTTFSVSYSVGFVDVYLNGIRLTDSEYTASNGTSVILSEGASLGDIVDLVAYTGGVTGSQGLQGVQGTTGSQGIQGTTGTAGSQGIQGIQGSGLTIVDDTSTNATRYVLFDDVTSGLVTTANVSSSKLTFNPSTGSLDISGGISIGSTANIRQVAESVTNSFNSTLSPSAGTLTIDVSLGTVILGDLNASVTTWAFTNVPTSFSRAITVTAIIDGDTAQTYGDACTVNGNSITNGVKWAGGSAPTATNNFDIITFAIIRDASGTINVFGSSITNYS